MSHLAPTSYEREREREREDDRSYESEKTRPDGGSSLRSACGTSFHLLVDTIYLYTRDKKNKKLGIGVVTVGIKNRFVF